MIDCESINSALASHPLYWGDSAIAIRSADVQARTGAFAKENDALYYRESFEPRPSTRGFDVDIIDLTKLQALWQRRRQFLANLFGKHHFQQIEQSIGDIPNAASNEYHCHEGGHNVGMPISFKYAKGYFRPNGNTCWPLIYMEELRADILSLRFALEILSDSAAAAVFLFQICHRFGLALESCVRGKAGIGPLPFLLFTELRRIKAIQLQREKHRVWLRFVNLNKGYLNDAILRLATLGERTFGKWEQQTQDLTSLALRYARWYRSRLLNAAAMAEFGDLFCCAESDRR
ncbi:MAG: hypothetical protein DME97_14705 [Verrucomicrobia bacterium]|nr:MAG: hypothetical protein DME97_14705 [Verrucomicrobiota bacterium]